MRWSLNFTAEIEVKIEINVDNIHEFLDLGTDVEWRVEQDYNVVIETPKNIGYQLATLREADNGLSLKRATKVRDGRWIFREMDIFDEEEEPWAFGAHFKDAAGDFLVDSSELHSIQVDSDSED